MSKVIVVKRPFSIGGVSQDVDAEVTVSDVFAIELIGRGDAVLKVAEAAYNEPRTDVKIASANITDSTAAGRAVLTAASAAAILAALGVTYGAADSGGAGFRYLKIPNA